MKGWSREFICATLNLSLRSVNQHIREGMLSLQRAVYKYRCETQIWRYELDAVELYGCVKNDSYRRGQGQRVNVGRVSANPMSLEMFLDVVEQYVKED